MPSEKRTRQDTGRMSRLEQQRAVERRNQRKRQLRALGLLLGGLVIVALLISVFASDDDDTDVATDDTSETTDTTEASEATTTTAGEDEEFAYGTTPCPAEGSAPSTSFEDAFEQCIDPAKTYTATFDTTAGKVVVELDTERTPGTANSFVALARAGYYDDTLLFRTDPSIGIIQGGSPTTNDPSDPGPGFNIPDEGGSFTYEPGQLVMARSQGPDSAGAQFFFAVDDAVSALDAQGTYVVFGQVVEGLDVLEQVLASHEDQPDNPLGGAPNPEVTVTSVTVSEA
jgi:cyclophilin family peptidyl-prolyl cis-trans isomerase